LKDAQRYHDAILAIAAGRHQAVRNIWLDPAWRYRYADAMQRIDLAPLIGE
jgi:hypothetical protein